MVRRMRLKTKNKNSQQWKKGHSSDSNPKFRLHRQAAAVFFGAIGHDGLSAENDSTNAFLGNLPDDTTINKAANEFSDAVSLADSQNSKLSGFTNCSNPTFEKVHRTWKSGSSIQSDILAVLAAITELIHENDGEESETEYFGALLTALETPKALPHAQKAATAYLLSLVTPKLPPEILRNRFSAASKILYTNLGMHAEMGGGNPMIVKYLTNSFGILLAAQPISSWSATNTEKMFESILTFCLHDHPRVRKVARQAVARIVTDTECHPSARICADFCVREIERSGGAGKGSAVTLNLLKVLEYTMYRFSETGFKAVAETILKLMTLSDVTVTAGAMAALYRTFLRRPNEETLPAKMNAQIVLALYDFRPLASDSVLCKFWLQLMCEVHISLLFSDPRLCASYLPRLFETAVQCMQTGSPPTTEASVQVLIRLINFCFPTDEDFRTLGNEEHWLVQLEACLKTLCGAMSLQSYAIWGKILKSCREFLGKLERRMAKLESFKKLLEIVGDLRESGEMVDKGVLESTVGAAVGHVGVEAVLSCFPLNLNPDAGSMPLDFPRSWLLPVLRNSITKESLEFFGQNLLLLAMKLRTKVLQWEKSGEKNLPAVYRLVELQLWDLLPAFCKDPADFVAAFPKLAQLLGAALLDRRDLRLKIMESLRNLIRFSAGKSEDEDVMRKYAKNYLPILFNIYTAEEWERKNGVGLAALETVKLYLPLVPEEILTQYVKSALAKLESEADQVKIGRLLDLIIVMTFYLNKEQLQAIWVLVNPWIENKADKKRKEERTLQKKSYQFLQTVCNAETQEARAWVEKSFQMLAKILGNQAYRPVPPAEAYRLQSIEGVAVMIKDGMIKWSSKTTRKFLDSVFEESVHCLGSGYNVKTRKAAARTLLKLVNLTITLEEGNVARVVSRTFQAVKDGVVKVDGYSAANSDLVKPLFVSYRLLVTEFRNDVTPETVGFLVSEFRNNVVNQNRSIAREALELMRTLLKVVPDMTLAQFSDLFLPAFFAQDSGVPSAERQRNKAILRKLIGKFGPTTVEKYASECWIKQINKLKKELGRAEKKREFNKANPHHSTESRDGDSESVGRSILTGVSRPDTVANLLRDSSDESEGEEMTEWEERRTVKSSRKSRMNVPVWLKEGEDDEIMDLLDEKSVGQKLTATNPSEKREPRDVNRGFRTAKDGRIILSEETAEDEENDLKDEEEEADDLTDIVIGKKRKIPKKDADESAKKQKLNDTPFSENGYRPGGIGIHRKLPEKTPVGGRFRAKKAKGDVKKKGQTIEPYAYLPMDMKALNRRKKSKVKGQFKSLVQGAKKGATKGSKGRRKIKS